MDLGLPVTLIVETTLAILLGATLFCGVVLERRLRNLRADQDELAGTIRALNGAITAAQLSLAGLRTAARDADETLGRKLNTARALSDELSLLNVAGERIATRMENARDTTASAKNPPAPTLRAVR